MSSVGIAEFKSKCLKILQKVHETGMPVLITKRDKPLAKVVPIKEEKAIINLKDSILYQEEDITSTGETWEVNS